MTINSIATATMRISTRALIITSSFVVDTALWIGQYTVDRFCRGCRSVWCRASQDCHSSIDPALDILLAAVFALLYSYHNAYSRGAAHDHTSSVPSLDTAADGLGFS